MWLSRFKLWIAAWFRGTTFRTPVDMEQDAPQVPRTERKPRAKVNEDATQAHYYMGDLLAQLDNYFSDFEYLKRGHPNMAAVFERFGVGVCSSNRLTSADLEPSFIARLPAQGCFYSGRHDTADTLVWRFMYFQKRNRPINVQVTNHTVYEIGGVYGVKQRNFFQFYIAIDEAGSIRVLKQIRPVYHSVGKGSRRANIFRMEWVYPAFLMDWVADSNKRRNATDTVDEFAASLFSFMANNVQRNEFDMNVRVRKDGRIATFSINMLRTPYFFADRDKTKNENGNTVRILHIVRPHTRNGKAIRAHWRGERRFTWNGYEVSIGMPGKHFAPLTEFAAAAWEEVDLAQNDTRKFVDAVAAAKMIDSTITAGRSNAA